jgi:hypothetical protein
MYFSFFKAFAVKFAPMCRVCKNFNFMFIPNFRTMFHYHSQTSFSTKFLEKGIFFRKLNIRQHEHFCPTLRLKFPSNCPKMMNHHSLPVDLSTCQNYWTLWVGSLMFQVPGVCWNCPQLFRILPRQNRD